MTQRTQQQHLPMPTSRGWRVDHLVQCHGWDEHIPPGDAELAHLYAHGLGGRPDLAEDNLTHTHTPPMPVAGMHQRTSGLAVASLVLGILWFFWLGSILAVIFGHVAQREIRRSGGHVGGQGLATAGLVLGYIGVGVFLLLFVALALGSLGAGS